MRKVNALLSMGILVLLLIHMLIGAMQLAGILAGGSLLMKILAWVMLAMLAMHVLIGIRLTADTLRAVKHAGASYFKENLAFWVRRISGMAVLAFAACHVVIFLGTTQDGAFRLHLFAGAELATQLLLVASVAVHVLTNLRPLMISLGVKGFRSILPDVLAILAALLLAAGLGFLAYFIRWNLV